MKIKVKRIASDSDATLSTIWVDGEFACFGLEDEYRKDKVAKETRIPAGEYRIGLRTEGGFNSRYAKKFSDFHKGMLQVCDVPGFEYILIHIGNTEEDTAGCLLVGLGASKPANGYGTFSIQSSKSAYSNLYRQVIDAAIADDLTILYIDFDRS